MHRSIKAFIYKGDNYYVAECHEIAVVTQGKTLDETIAILERRWLCTWKVKIQLIST
jgi:predicted RNase H-like HicB family nuclease